MITWEGFSHPFRLLVEALGQAEAMLHRPTRRVLQKQLYFSGVLLLWPCLLVGGAIGLIVANGFIVQLGVQAAAAALPLLGWLLFKEVGPVLVALLLVAHSTPAIASELAMMKLGGDIRALEVLRIPPLGYLVLPRMLGMAGALVVLTFLANGAAMFSAAMMLGIGRPLDTLQDWQGSQPLLDFLQVVGKSLLFGVVVALIACARGLSVRYAGIEVPLMASRAVLHSLLAVLLLDGVWVLLANLLAGTRIG